LRRKDREVKDKKAIESIIKRATVCRIALSENNLPYVVPVSFGYKDNCLYFHSAPEGRKIDTIKQNNNVCFELDVDCEFVKKSEQPCSWCMKYRSVIGFGKAFLVQGTEQKRKALDIIVGHYSGSPYQYPYPEDMISNIAVVKVEVDSVTAKKSGY
jgi:nitroimidazol reductase NimA-like FMN-containing flavoprotein (pyridoxamine 5'-phosphate oxidase superfamily)